MKTHHIEIIEEAAEGKGDLLSLLRDRFSADAIVVAEASDHVASARLGGYEVPEILDRIDVFESIDGFPTHATFDRAGADRFEGRLIRESDASGQPCQRLDRHLMCFGEVTEASETKATSMEPRVSKFSLPVTGAAPGDHLFATCHDYLAFDGDGQAYRIASIVTGFEAMKMEINQ
ncbi:hypothetical protein OAF82_01230 [bacterium]|nr:hypothetical protein [bacterium]